MANSVDRDQTAPTGAVCSGSMLFASMLNSSVMLGNYLQQTTSADDIFQMHFFLGAIRVNIANKTFVTVKIQNLVGGITVEMRQTCMEYLRRLTLKAPIITKVVCFCRLLKCLKASTNNQCRSRSIYLSDMAASILTLTLKAPITTAADDFS